MAVDLEQAWAAVFELLSVEPNDDDLEDELERIAAHRDRVRAAHGLRARHPEIDAMDYDEYVAFLDQLPADLEERYADIGLFDELLDDLDGDLGELTAMRGELQALARRRSSAWKRLAAAVDARSRRQDAAREKTRSRIDALRAAIRRDIKAMRR